MCQAVSHGQLCALDLACHIPHGDEIRIAVFFCKIQLFSVQEEDHTAGELSERMLIASIHVCDGAPADTGVFRVFAWFFRQNQVFPVQRRRIGCCRALYCLSFRGSKIRSFCFPQQWFRHFTAAQKGLCLLQTLKSLVNCARITVYLRFARIPCPVDARNLSLFYRIVIFLCHVFLLFAHDTPALCCPKKILFHRTSEQIPHAGSCHVCSI